jgi:hypothetical protein
VKLISEEPTSTWELDAHSYAGYADEVLALSSRVRKAFKVSGVNGSDTLVTKTMLGVFGCVPAFDRYFRRGFGCQTLCKPALLRIGDYYQDNKVQIDAAQVLTLDFSTGADTKRRYSQAKIIDMVFFQEGYGGN